MKGYFCRTLEGLFLPEQFAGKQSEGHGYEIKRLEVVTYIVCSDLMVVPKSVRGRIPFDRCGAK